MSCAGHVQTPSATGRTKARDEGLAGVPLVGADTGVPRLLAETPAVFVPKKYVIQKTGFSQDACRNSKITQ